MNRYKIGIFGGIIASLNHLIIVILTASLFNLLRNLDKLSSTLILQTAVNSLLLILLFLLTLFGHILFYLGIIKFSEDFDTSRSIKTAGVMGIIGSVLMPILIGFAIEGLALLILSTSVYTLISTNKEFKNRINKRTHSLIKIACVLGAIAGLAKMSIFGSIIGAPISIFFYLSMCFVFYELR